MNDRYCCENRIARPTNCKNCGAPLHGSKCEYCGTEYNLVSGLEAKLNELKFRTANAQQIANIKFGTPIGYKIVTYSPRFYKRREYVTKGNGESK